jgi:hypothetical protein
MGVPRIRTLPLSPTVWRVQHNAAVAKADEVYGRVVEEATAGLNTGLATRGGAPAFLVRAFSLAEQEDLLMDFDQLTTMEKVQALWQYIDVVGTWVYVVRTSYWSLFFSNQTSGIKYNT